jgi:hypothetical protein
MLQRTAVGSVPLDTERIARASLHHRNPYVQLRDRLGLNDEKEQ